MRKQRNVKHLIIGVLLVIVGAVLVYLGLSRFDSRPTVKIGNNVIKVQIADNPDTYAKGLSGRDSLATDEGMLFVFERPAQPGFWMKDMKFPIDIVWISQDKKIVAITPSLGVDSYPATFRPPEPVLYVLEVNAGISARNGWLAGDSVEINL